MGGNDRPRRVGVALGVGSRNRTGLPLSVSPRWGDAATGGQTLWQEQVYRRYVPEGMGDAWDEGGCRPASRRARGTS